MLFPHLLYNGLMLAADVALLLFLARHRDARGMARGVLWGGLIAVGIAVGVYTFTSGSRYAGSMFLLLGLLTWGIFLHGTVLWTGAGLLLRRAHPRLAGSSFAVAGALVLVAAYSMLIEPRWLEVTHHEIVTSKLTRPVRVVVVSDLQCASVGDYERAALRRAMAEKPDLVLLPGDYLHTLTAEGYLEELPRLRDAFAEAGLAAPLGVFAVQGNVDRPGWPSLFEGLAVEAHELTRQTTTGELVVTALSFEDSHGTDLTVPSSEAFQIVVGHQPNFAIGDVPADLLVAGHTHGGQIRIPGWGPLLTLSAVPRAWAAGRTDLGDGRTLLVSRGVGLERGHAPRVRLFCRPEIVVIDLVPAGAEPGD